MTTATVTPSVPSVNGRTGVDRSVQAKFMAAEKAMDAVLIERTDDVRLVLAGMVASENVLLVGSAGVAKSMLARLIAQFLAVPAGGYFEYQLNRFTEPDELFGPFDLLRMKQTGELVRRTAGKLPVATVAFIDEYFNGSSAVINTLHRCMNERVYDDGSGEKKIPLSYVIGASNIIPSAATGHENCEAAFDRFLLRKEVKNVTSKQGRDRLLWDDALRTAPKLGVSVTLAELDQARKDASRLTVTPEARLALEQIVNEVEAKVGQMILPRRLQKSVSAIRAAAYLAGADQVETEHLEILCHVYWTAPEAATAVAEIVSRISNPIKTAVISYLAEASEVVKLVDLTNPAKALETGMAAKVKLREVYAKLAVMGKGKKRPDVNNALASIKSMADEVTSSISKATFASGVDSGAGF